MIPVLFTQGKVISRVQAPSGGAGADCTGYQQIGKVIYPSNPLQPWFDKTWRPEEIEEVKGKNAKLLRK
jgi:hypothetical protein